MASHAVALRRTADDPVLRRLQLGLAFFSLAEYGGWLVLLVYAFDRGGTTEAGLVAFATLLPGVVAAPLAGYVGDRFRPDRALPVGYLVQAVAFAATAAAMWSGRPPLAYGAAIVAFTAVTLTRPLMGALLPAVAKRPTDLVAASVANSFVQNTGRFAGPLIAAALLSVTDPGAALAVFAVLVAGAAAVTRSLSVTDAGSAPGVHTRQWPQLVAGVRTLRQSLALSLLVAIVTTTAAVGGAIDVLVVVFAEVVLGGDGSEAAILSSGVGLGALAGAVAAAGLIGGSRLLPYLVAGAGALGASLAALAGAGALAVALVLFAVVGLGESLLEVTGSAAIQRLAPGRVLARVFGVLEALEMLALAFGAVVATALIGAVGVRPAVAAIGVGAIVAIAACSIWFVRAGGDVPPPPPELVDRLLADPVFVGLDIPTLERLATSAASVDLPAGVRVVAEGDIGTDYFLVIDGSLTVCRAGVTVNQLGAGDSFGEIALIRDVPRMASVDTLTRTVLLSIGRDDFLEAVTGHPRCMDVATEVADRHVASWPETWQP